MSRFLATLKFSLTVIAVVFLSCVAVVMVVWAMGYRYDISSKQFEPTAMIVMKDRISDVEVFLNGDKIGTTLPLTVRFQKAGRYEVIIKKTGFNDWSDNFDLKIGQSHLINDVSLIAIKPTEEPYAKVPAIDSVAYDNGITVEDGEIYDGYDMVTRLFDNPLQVHRYKNMYVYQVKSEIRLYDPNCEQDYFLYTLSGEQLSPVSLVPFTDKLIIKLSSEKAILINPLLPSGA